MNNTPATPKADFLGDAGSFTQEQSDALQTKADLAARNAELIKNLDVADRSAKAAINYAKELRRSIRETRQRIKAGQGLSLTAANGLNDQAK